MEPNDDSRALQSAMPESLQKARPERCLRCDYSLTGLPAAHRCPECGLEYDEQTFVLGGIVRGTRGQRPGRAALWVVVALGLWPGAAVIAPLAMGTAGGFGCLAVAVLWIALLVYLIATSRRGGQGVEQFVFSAGGFGYCANLTPAGAADAQVIPWSDVDTVLVERKGANWHRIRIGTGRGSDGGPEHTRFDVGVRCREETAAWIRGFIEDRIRAARSPAPTPEEVPAG